MLLIKVLTIDIQQSQQERKIRRMAQRMALLEEELAELKNETNHDRQADSKRSA